jgi:hypothetical protein
MIRKPEPFAIGDRVRHSDSDVRRKSDSARAWSGRNKHVFLDAADKFAAARGTVTGIKPAHSFTPNAYAVDVLWDDGSSSGTLDYILAKA